MPEYLIQSGLSSYPAGLNDKDAALVLPLYRAVNNLSNKISAATGNVQLSSSELSQIAPFSGILDSRNMRVIAQASEALVYGQIVNLYDVAGVVTARKADCALLYEAHGLVASVTGAAVGEYCEILFMQGRTTAVSGSALGTQYWLSTAGQVQAVKPVAPNLIQPVAIGLGSAGVYLNIESVR